LKCLAGHYMDTDLVVASRALEMLIHEVCSARSIDGILTKFTTFVLRLEDLFRNYADARRVFEKVLMCDELQDVLAVLASYSEFVEQFIYSNPRFKPLISYADILLVSLRRVEAPVQAPTPQPSYSPRSRRIEIVRPATFQIEHMETRPAEAGEHKAEAKPKPIKLKKERRLLRRAAIIAIAVVVAIALLIAIYLLALASHGASTAPAELIPQTVLSNKRLFEASALNDIKRTVYGYDLPRSADEAVWRALEWVSKNIIYDYALSTARLVGGGGLELCDKVCYTAQHPLSTLANRRGVCIDYAVLIATALLSVNISPVYILAFEHPSHAAAAVAIGSTVFVLDQAPPPIELEDYFSYVVQNATGIGFTVFELGIERGYVVYRRALLNGLAESYSFDTTPSSVVTAALYEAAEELGIAPSEKAKEGLPRLEAKITVNAPKLSTASRSYSVWALYTPVFHKQWVSYTANIIVKAVEGERGKGWRYMWAELRNSSLVVYLSQ